MTDRFLSSSGADEIIDIVATAGGKFVGRTRLQKTVYLLKVGGFGGSFEFEYRHYGPYSEELSDVTTLAVIFGHLEEEKEQTSWGGIYSIYRSDARPTESASDARKRLILEAARANPIELELAATAAFLALEKYVNPWEETAERKPDKADRNRLARAKRLYNRIRQLDLPQSLPDI